MTINIAKWASWAVAPIGLLAMYFALTGKPVHAAWLGLLGQPLWFLISYLKRLPGVFVLSFAYTLLYAYGIIFV